MNKQRTVRENEKFEFEVEDDKERKNGWKLPSRKYNFASLL